MPAAIAPEVTIRYSFFERSNWSTMPAQQMDIDLPSGGNETGADFDDHTHSCSGCSRESFLFAYA